GIANLTYVRRKGDDRDALAFDTGPGVGIIDAVARLVAPNASYDADGRIAAQGVVNEAVVTELLADPYFDQPPPKSTGREYFGPDYARALHQRVPGPDGVASAVALTARSVARAIDRWVPGPAEVVVAGGGRLHPGLMAALAERLDPRPIARFDDL